MLADLDHLSAYQVEDACVNYRRDGGNKFFPTPGQVIEALKGPGYEPPRRLQAYDKREFEAPRTGKLKSVGEILRQNGFGRAAEDWDAWKEDRPADNARMGER